MPLGDSITEGYYTTNGYRKQLENDLIAGGYDFTFVGSRTEGSGDGILNPDHEGHPGATIKDFKTSVGLYDHVVPDALTTYKPDVVLLMVGTNNFYLGDDVNSAVIDYNQLLSQIVATEPGVKLIVGSIPYIDNGFTPTTHAKIDDFNSRISALVTTYQSEGYSVSFAGDITAAVGDDMPEGVHPSEAAYIRMGDVWYSSVQSVVRPNSSVPAPHSIPVFAVGMLAGAAWLRKSRSR